MICDVILLLVVFWFIEIILNKFCRFLFWLLIADAFDTEQLLDCIQKLKAGQPYQVPIYDFKIHRRCKDSFRQVLTSQHFEPLLVFPFNWFMDIVEST